MHTITEWVSGGGYLPVGGQDSSQTPSEYPWSAMLADRNRTLTTWEPGSEASAAGFVELGAGDTATGLGRRNCRRQKSGDQNRACREQASGGLELAESGAALYSSIYIYI